MNNAVNILTWVIRIGVGVLFIFSGFVKANDITGFAYKLDEYWQVFADGRGETLAGFFLSLKHISFALSWFISVFEIMLGFAMIMGWRMKIVTWIVLGMIVFFTFLTWYSWYYSAVQDCGCFGDAIKLTPYQSFMKDVVLLVLTIFLFVRRKHILPVPTPAIAQYVTVGSFAVFGFYSWWCYRHLPMIDFISAYKVGANIPENMTLFDENDIPVVHDFSEFCKSCEPDSARGLMPPGDGFKGATLYIVLYNPHEAAEAEIKAAGELAAAIRSKGGPLKVCGGTNLPDSLIKYNLPFLVSGQDEKMLKTMVRTSPGYVLLKDGIVQKKWSRVDVPTVDELLELAQ